MYNVHVSVFMSIIQDEMWKCYTAFLIRDMPMSGSPSCVHLYRILHNERERGKTLILSVLTVRR